MKTIQTSDRFIQLDLSDLEDLTELEAGQGAGKTTALETLTSQRVLLVASSNPLLRQIQLRMPDMDWQMHIQEDGHTKKGEDLENYLKAKHCLCNIQSLHLWTGVETSLDVFAIDEADITLKDLYLYRPQPELVETNISQLIWRMRSTSSVICMGAHSTGFLSLFNERNLQRKHTRYINKYSDLEGKRLGLCDNNKQLRTLIEAQLEKRISDPKKHGGVFMPTEYKGHLQTMVEAWKERFPTLKIRIVNADNPLTEQELRDLADPNKRTEWDLLICSPSLRDGFHIMGSFELVAGDYSQSANDILTDQEIINALLRVRTCKEFALHCKDTKSLEGTLKSYQILEKRGLDFIDLPKHFRLTDPRTGKIVTKNTEEKIGFEFWTNYREEHIKGRKYKIPTIWEKRGGECYFPDYESKTVPTYSKESQMNKVMRAEPYNSNDWGARIDNYRIIHSEILKIFGEVTEQTYLAWDNGQWKKNEEREARLFKTKVKDGFNDNEIEIDICAEKFIREIGEYVVGVDDSGEVYTIHKDCFLNWAIWIDLKENKDQWNKLIGRISGLESLKIKDRHLSTESNACLEWLADLLRKYNYRVDCLEAKPQKTKSSKRQLAEPKYRSQLKQWRSEGNKNKPLERYLFQRLAENKERLRYLSNEAQDFLNCYPHVVISKHQLNNSNCRS